METINKGQKSGSCQLLVIKGCNTPLTDTKKSNTHPYTDNLLTLARERKANW